MKTAEEEEEEDEPFEKPETLKLPVGIVTVSEQEQWAKNPKYYPNLA